MAKEFYKINGEALRRELKKRGLSMHEVSEEMGFDKQFLNNVTAPSKEKINRTAKNYLEKVYGISLETYAAKTGIAEIPQQMEFVDFINIDYEKLYQVIKKAMIDAYYTINNGETDNG